MSLAEFGAGRLARLLQTREVSAREVADAFLERIQALDADIGAFLWMDPEWVRFQADQAQAMLDRGAGCALTGLPVAVKDNICTQRLPTTCASAILRGYRPPYDATVVERLQALGAVILGKTNLDEFAMGSSTETSAYQLTRNPWDRERVPGGSSGGSAAAVAADLAPLALGSDTGGSIRQPAALCGISGLKPTYGRVSRFGLVAFASSLDQIGPMARDVSDLALLLEAIAGHDSKDATSVPLEAPSFALEDWAGNGDLRNVKIGVPRQFFGHGVDPEVGKVVRQALEVLASAGAEVAETDIPSIAYGVETYYIVAPAEASSNLARYDGIRYGYRSRAWSGHVDLVEQTREEGFGEEVKRRILLGTYALSAGYYDDYYLKAQKVRTRVKLEFEESLRTFDCLAGPTSPTVAFRIGELIQDPLAMKMADVLTIPANLYGGPAVSVPCGFAHGLPVGLQLVGRAHEETALLRVAHAFQLRTRYHLERPKLPFGP